MHSLSTNTINDALIAGRLAIKSNTISELFAQHQDLSAELLMVGVSVPGRIGDGAGPPMAHHGYDTLRKFKLPAEQTINRLRKLYAETPLDEAWVWNTCSRIECYGWVREPFGKIDRAELLDQMVQGVLGESAAAHCEMNTLCGTEALHHVLRTAAGLNSELPGEMEVSQQLRGALQVARFAETAGPLTEMLVEKACEIEQDMRRSTAWGRFAPSYCSALLERLGSVIDTPYDRQRIAVIGRSGTALSLLKLLTDQHGVPSDHIALVHKGTRRGGAVKQIRRLVPDGRKIRVGTYDDPVILDVIAESDVVFYGIDLPRAVLDGEKLREKLQTERPPLTIVDFNTLGSTTNLADVPGVVLWDADRVQREVNHFADSMCQSASFWNTVEQVEQRLSEHAARVAATFNGHAEPVRAKAQSTA